MQYQYKTINLGNGIVLPYYEKGDVSGQPIIFLHGVTGSHRSFDRIAPYIPETFRSYFITQRGHGDASRPATGYEARDLSTDIAGFMDRMNIGSAILVGHSMGSFVSQRLAIDHPARVKGLVLIGSFATCAGNAGVEQFYETTISKLTDPIVAGFAREFQTSTFANHIPDAFLDVMVTESLKVPASIWKQACKAMIENDHTPELSRITAPTLLIWGDRDSYVSRLDQEILLRSIAGSRLLSYPGVGHSPTWEVPERLASDIVSFAGELLREA
jgi:non-heme chloroperoxidase